MATKIAASSCCCYCSCSVRLSLSFSLSQVLSARTVNKSSRMCNLLASQAQVMQHCRWSSDQAVNGLYHWCNAAMSFLPNIICKVPKKDFYTIWSATCFLFLRLQCPLLTLCSWAGPVCVYVLGLVIAFGWLFAAHDTTVRGQHQQLLSLSLSLALCRRSHIVRGRNVLCITQTNCAWRWQGIPVCGKRRRLGKGENAMAMAIQPRYVDSIRETRM